MPAKVWWKCHTWQRNERLVCPAIGSWPSTKACAFQGMVPKCRAFAYWRTFNKNNECRKQRHRLTNQMSVLISYCFQSSLRRHTGKKFKARNRELSPYVVFHIFNYWRISPTWHSLHIKGDTLELAIFRCRWAKRKMWRIGNGLVGDFIRESSSRWVTSLLAQHDKQNSSAPTRKLELNL